MMQSGLTNGWYHHGWAKGSRYTEDHSGCTEVGCFHSWRLCHTLPHVLSLLSQRTRSPQRNHASPGQKEPHPRWLQQVAKGVYWPCPALAVIKYSEFTLPRVKPLATINCKMDIKNSCLDWHLDFQLRLPWCPNYVRINATAQVSWVLGVPDASEGTCISLEISLDHGQWLANVMIRRGEWWLIEFDW